MSRPQRVLTRQEAYRITLDKFEADLRRKYPYVNRRSLRTMAQKSVRLAMKQFPQRKIVLQAKPANFFERLKELLHLGTVRYVE
jgi:hypothetical protein